MGEAFEHRRMRVSDLTPDDADDLFAPEYSQASHGFAVGDVVRRSTASNHTKAQADSESSIGVGLSIVVHVEDTSNFSLLRHGNHHAVTVTGHGLGSFGQKVYLSQSVAGAMTASKPGSGLIVYLGFVIDANTLMWEPGAYIQEV